MRAARSSPIPAVAVRWLTAVFLPGAVGRLLSLAVAGTPHRLQLALAARAGRGSRAVSDGVSRR
ncbi:DUF4345 family protein [Streptomyces wuyuanensis]|uniref:DUF4345 family protein n=1 Tax=Streptomyces wuyuanensis TaxID=1196353 RepID=UPI00371E92E0